MSWINQLVSVEQAITLACSKSARRRETVQLIAVTKTHPPELVREVLAEGLLHIGENKVQELKAKKEIIGEKGYWHLIGHLQSNKVKHAVRLADSIDSVDSESLAKEIDQRCGEIGRTMPILIEVNVSGEASKYGVAREQLPLLVERVNALKHVEVRGVMTLAPYFDDPEKARPFFVLLREIRDEVEKSTGIHLPEISMGMSHDFVQAIEEGATQVRLGSILFGNRGTPLPKETFQS